jgi:Zn-dependent protease
MADRRLTLGAQRNLFRPSAIFLGLVALWITGGVMAWLEFGSTSVNVILFVLAGWLVSLSLHEYAHAIFAYRAGDRGVVERGYLTLNPLKYTHPVLSIVFPVIILLIGGIGLPGGAVWVDHHAVRGKVQESLISAAGPAVNVIFTIVLAVPFFFVDFVTVANHLTFWAALAFLGFLQLTASILNLLPVPGLDGGNLLRPWLPPGWGKAFDTVAPFGMLLIFAALFEPRVNRIFFTEVYELTAAVGLPLDLVAEGQALLQFWR